MEHGYCLMFKINRIAHIRHQCSKTTVLSYHICLINTGVEKMNNIQIKIITLTAGTLWFDFLL